MISMAYCYFIWLLINLFKNITNLGSSLNGREGDASTCRCEVSMWTRHNNYEEKVLWCYQYSHHCWLAHVYMKLNKLLIVFHSSYFWNSFYYKPLSSCWSVDFVKYCILNFVMNNYNFTTVYSRSGVAEVNSEKNASLECKIIACLWSLMSGCTYLVYTRMSWQES